MAKDNIFETLHRWNIEKYKSSPIGYPLVIICSFVYFVVLVFLLLWFLKPVPYEIEGSCNSGFIGVDFQSEFKNEEWKERNEYEVYNPHNFTRYKPNIIPKKLNLKNIDGLNCNFKVKGYLPVWLLANLG